MNKIEQLRKLLDGYEYGSDDEEETLRPPKRAGWDRLCAIAEAYNITVYAPGVYHGRPEVVITDGCYAYAVVGGNVETIAG